MTFILALTAAMQPAAAAPRASDFDVALDRAYARTVRLPCKGKGCASPTRVLMLPTGAGGMCWDNLVPMPGFRDAAGRIFSGAGLDVGIDPRQQVGGTLSRSVVVRMKGDEPRRVCLPDVIVAGGVAATLSARGAVEPDALIDGAETGPRTRGFRIAREGADRPSAVESALIGALGHGFVGVTSIRAPRSTTLTGMFLKLVFGSDAGSIVTVAIETARPATIMLGHRVLGTTNKVLSLAASAVKDLRLSRDGHATSVEGCRAVVEDRRWLLRC